MKRTAGFGITFAVVLAMGVGTVAQSAHTVRENVFTLSAEEAYERGMGAFGVDRNLKTGELQLHDHVLIEDDGPGVSALIPYIQEEDRGGTEEFSDKVLIKKVLRVDRPQAMAARAYVRPGGVVMEVNGSPVEAHGRYASIDPGLLKTGDNEVVFGLHGEGKIQVARKEHMLANAPERKDGPWRSLKSTDGGKTWEPIQGECVVRLILSQYVPEGHVISPVIDLGRAGDDGLMVQSPVSVAGVSLQRDGDTPDGTQVVLALRTGSSPVYEAAFWSDWMTDSDHVPAGHRYLQWKAALRTSDPTVTPTVRSVTVRARVAAQAPPDWAAKVALKDSHNEEIRYTSMPFEYEDPHHPKLVALREKYRLDEVVAPGRSEFEKQVLLKNWVSKQWKYHPPEGHYPAWDADEIMTRKIGFCVQYAIVYVECAAAMGWPARFVFGEHPGIMGGHEVSEIWSNQYDKWVVMDPNGNRYYFDPKLNVPLSMLETHDRMIRHYYGDKPAVPANKPREKSYADDLVTVPGVEMTPEVPTGTPKGWTAWTKWLTLHYVPRNNFYSKPHPLPMLQGWGWDWPYYWCWYDKQTPRKPRYHHLTSRRSDLEWTLNQVRFDVAYGAEAGTLRIQMGTVTPNFETFLAKVDGGQWKPTERAFTWPLHEGRNRVEMRVRNTSGVEGPVSFIDVEYGK